MIIHNYWAHGGAKMPGMDKTGPNSEGPLTGRKRGKCGGSEDQEIGFGRGRGFGMGRGAGRGYGWRARTSAMQTPVELSKEDKRKILEQELQDLKAETEALNKKLEEMQ